MFDKIKAQNLELPEGTQIHRSYCVLLNSTKYNRNVGCKLHDNAYGINGGGGGKERTSADKMLYGHMKANRDPFALPAYLALRLCGWAWFNYHGTPWRGQLVKKFCHG